MNILVDINHPAHVHLFKHFIWEMENRNHNVFISVKDIPSAEELLNIYGFDFIELGNKSDSILGKAINQFNYNRKLFSIVKKHKIDFGIGSSLTIDHISKITKMTSIHLSDDDAEVVPFTVKYAYPFSDVILSPIVTIFQRFIDKNINYKGYHELAYLHPNRFLPDETVLKEAGIVVGEKYFILRFNSFKAHHDIGIQGISIENKRKLVKMLSEYGRVFITTERDIDPEFKPYQIKIAADKIHSFLYYATMFVGDSQTMTSEAAVLGTPAIRSNSFVGRIAYLEEEEHKYHLTYGFKPDENENMFSKIIELLSMPNLKVEWQKRRNKMLADKIDVTAFLVWFIENYPESFKIMKENPDYQNRFK